MLLNLILIDTKMKAIKLFFAIALLVCLAPMPYGFYMLIRIVAAILFVIFAGQFYEAKKEELAITFGILAFLFQPLIKIPLGRDVWNMVDVAVAILLLILAIWLSKLAILLSIRLAIASKLAITLSRLYFSLSNCCL